MSVRAVAYMKELSICPNGEMITRTEKLVGIVLADNHQDRVNRPTFPEVDTIAEDALVSVRQCQRVFSSLERKGVIRREYPGGVGRGKTTYYFFVELEAKTAPKLAAKATSKGCHDVTLSDCGKIPERVTEGCQKGDISSTAYIEERKQKQQEQVQNPQPPFAKGASEAKHVQTPLEATTNGSSQDAELERAVDQVMDGCGFVRENKRLRRVIRSAIGLERSQGTAIAVTANAMQDAWIEQALQSSLLRVKIGAMKFFGMGYWKNQNAWHWDKEAIERYRRSRVGVW